jgi:polyferredoxin
VLVIIVAAAGYTLWHRVPVKVDVIRDRTTLAREVGDGQIENIYRLQVMNTQERTQRLKISASGIDSIVIHDLPQLVEVRPASSKLLPVAVRVDADKAKKGISRIEFNIVAVDDAGRPAPDVFSIHEKSAFYKP